MSSHDDIPEPPPYDEKLDADLIEKYQVPFDDSKPPIFFKFS